MPDRTVVTTSITKKAPAPDGRRKKDASPAPEPSSPPLALVERLKSLTHSNSHWHVELRANVPDRP